MHHRHPRANHEQLDRAWMDLYLELGAIEAGTDNRLDEDMAAKFATHYREPIQQEPAVLAPAFGRNFHKRERCDIGRVRTARRDGDWNDWSRAGSSASASESARASSNCTNEGKHATRCNDTEDTELPLR
jgi:hypothetical protein